MKQTIKIVSLNIQHGWNSDPPLPLLIRQRTVLPNLNKIATLLEKHKPDIVLLQEVDRISPLTQKVDQLKYLASRVGYLHRTHGASSELRVGRQVVYAAGCGILSRFPITAVENVRFSASFPTPPKGCLIATLAINPEKKLTVVSAHFPPFDVLRLRSRRSKIERIAEALCDKGPIVIGGDFNVSFSGFDKKNIEILATRLNVRTHRAVLDKRLATYPARDPRRKIDWIFVSPDIHMSEYAVLPERVSDHLAIGTTISV